MSIKSITNTRRAHCNQLPSSPGICFGPASGLSIGQVLPLAQQAEQAGFSSVWTGEFGNDCLAWVQALALATKNCRVGSSIVNVYLRHPAVVAAATAVIAELSQSRFVLGLGASHRSIVEESLGLKLVRPLDYLEEYVQVIRAALSGRPVDHQGSFFRLEGYQFGARITGPAVPIYVAVLGLIAAERAACYADGIILTLTPPAYAAELVARLKRSAQSVGRQAEAIEVVQILPCFLSQDIAAAEEAACRMICRYTALPFYGNMFSRAGFQNEVSTIRAALATGAEASAWQAVSPAMLAALVAAGDWTVCEQAIERHHQAGADSVVLYPNPVTGDTAVDWAKAASAVILERRESVKDFTH